MNHDKVKSLYSSLARGFGPKAELAEMVWQVFVTDQAKPRYNQAHAMLCFLVAKNVDETLYKIHDDRKIAVTAAESVLGEALSSLPYFGSKYDDYLRPKGLIFTHGNYYRDSRMTLWEDEVLRQTRDQVPQQYSSIIDEATYCYLIAKTKSKNQRVAVVPKSVLQFVAIQLMESTPRKQELIGEWHKKYKSHAWASAMESLNKLAQFTGINIEGTTITDISLKTDPLPEKEITNAAPLRPLSQERSSSPAPKPAIEKPATPAFSIAVKKSPPRATFPRFTAPHPENKPQLIFNEAAQSLQKNLDDLKTKGKITKVEHEVYSLRHVVPEGKPQPSYQEISRYVDQPTPIVIMMEKNVAKVLAAVNAEPETNSPPSPQ